MKYIFLDIDGTLYSTAINDIPQSARDAMRIARQNGNKIFLCTGRSLAECQKYLGYEVDGFVFAAGALIYAEKKRIYDHPIPREDVARLKQLIMGMDMGIACEGMAGAYCNEKGFEAVMRYCSSPTASREEQAAAAAASGFYSLEYEHEDEFIYKVCVYDSRMNLYQEMRKRLWAPYISTVTMRDIENGHYCEEITNGTITKSTGIAHVLKQYNADVSDAVAIGDSENDICMIRDCGIGIAMGNAFPHVKEAADFVTTDINDNGIWNAFERIGVLKNDSDADTESGH